MVSIKLEHPILTLDDYEELEKMEDIGYVIRRTAAHLGKREPRYLVDNYYRVQGIRLIAASQKRAADAADEPVVALDYFLRLYKHNETIAKRMLQAYAESKKAALWALSICGIGPVLAAGLSAHIEIEKAPPVGHIWSFAGLDPSKKWEPGGKRPWNADLKTLCWKISESFVKVKNRDEDVYGKVYDQRKQLEEARNEAGEFAEQAKAKLAATKIGKGTEAYKFYSQGKLPPGHIHRRAQRYAVKLFLAHYHHVAYEAHYGTPPPKPYILTQPNHAHYITPPNWPMVA